MKSLFFFASYILMHGYCTAVDFSNVNPLFPSSSDTLAIDGDRYQVKWLVREYFNVGNWGNRWELEGNDAIAKISNGKLYITDHGTGTTLWNKSEFPENLIIRYKTRAEGKKIANKTNFNLLSHARGTDGQPLSIGKRSKRTGAYKEYHTFPNYISTFTFKHARIRKDPGFTLLSNSAEYSETNKTYDIAYTVDNGRIRYYVNGKKIHDVSDLTPLRGGKLGIRTWDTEAWWDDIEIGMLVGKHR